MRREKLKIRSLTDSITISRQDKGYLNETLATLKRTRQKTSKSELLALGMVLLKKKSTKEIEQLLYEST